jgi:hypothetical protein
MIYRKDKDSPLTCDEVDGNFLELEQRCQDLEQDIEALQDALRDAKNCACKAGTSTFLLKGRELTIVNPAGEKKTLVIPLWEVTGPWEAKKLYYPGDIAQWNDWVYVCIAEHTSQELPDDAFDTSSSDASEKLSASNHSAQSDLSYVSGVPEVLDPAVWKQLART